MKKPHIAPLTFSKNAYSVLKRVTLAGMTTIIVSSLGLLSGCAQLSKSTENSAALQVVSSVNLTDTDPADLVKPQSTQNHQTLKKPTNQILGLDPKSEIHQRAMQPELLMDAPIASLTFDNIWDEITSDLTLGDSHFDDFSGYLNYYKKRPDYLKRVSKRAQPYLHFIFSEVKQRNMPYEMALLPIIESGFRVSAKSHQNALGLWQFIPQTGHFYGLEKNWWYEGRKDIIHSTQAALTYLQKLHNINNNDWLLALASYNGGMGNVWKAVKKYKQKHPNIEQPTFWQIRPYLPKETQHYVPQLLAVAHALENQTEFKQTVEAIENKAFFGVVELDKQISLDKVALLSGTSNTLLAQLNPGYLRPATPPKGPFHIALPVDNIATFQKQLLSNDALFDIQWTQYKIQRGDTLSGIAQTYKTSSTAIKKLNNMRNSKIREGKTLLIPLPQDYTQIFNKTPKQAPIYNGPKFFHTVTSGESLWTIARYYNTQIKTLCHWNNIGVRTPLRKGQKLEIRSNQYGHQLTYTLKEGDSLWSVAQKFNVTTRDLSAWNRIKRSKTLQPGMKLTVWQPKSSPVNTLTSNKHNRDDQIAALLKSKQYKRYTVKSGDSLWIIAQANKVSIQVIVSYNQIPEKAYLKPGQILKIPYVQNT